MQITTDHSFLVTAFVPHYCSVFIFLLSAAIKLICQYADVSNKYIILKNSTLELLKFLKSTAVHANNVNVCL